MWALVTCILNTLHCSAHLTKPMKPECRKAKQVRVWGVCKRQLTYISVFVVFFLYLGFLLSHMELCLCLVVLNDFTLGLTFPYSFDVAGLVNINSYTRT